MLRQQGARLAATGDRRESQVRALLTEQALAAELELDLQDARHAAALTPAQAHALDSMLAELGRDISSVPVFELGLAQLLERVGGRRVCREAEHVYHLISAPPKTRGICDIDGSELYQRDDDTEPVIRARYQKQWVEAARPVVDHYDAAGLVVRIDAGGTREQVSAEIDALLARLGDGS